MVNSGAATITVNQRPTGNITGIQSICNGSSALITLTVTGSGIVNGTLSPGAIPFSGTAGAITVTVSPTATTTYTIATLTDANCTANAGDKTGSAVVTVNPLPAPPTITPASATICQGSILPLSAGTAPFADSKSATYSGTISIADNNASGAANSLNISGIPLGAVINSVSVNFNITHGRTADLRINLKAPNGNVLNLVNQKAGLNFSNTTINSTSTTGIPATGAHTGTYRPDAANNVTGATAVGGNTSNVTAFSSLFNVPNGNWTFSARDVVSGTSGSITSWSITINYTVISTPTPVTWSPATDLFTDAGGTIPYGGELLTTVYTKPGTPTNRTYTATLFDGNSCSSSSAVVVKVNQTPEVTIGAQYCDPAFPGKVTLTATSTPAATNYLWSTGASGPVIHVDIADVYSVTALIGGCAGTAEISVAQELVVMVILSNGNDGSFTSGYAYKPDLHRKKR